MSIYSPIDNDYKNGLIIDNYENDINTEQSDLYNIIIPIGFIQIYFDNTNPNNIYKNTTWELIKNEVYIGGNDSTKPIGELLGQDNINMVNKDGTGIFRLKNNIDKFNSKNMKGDEHAYNFIYLNNLLISNELPHIKVKAWKRTK